MAKTFIVVSSYVDSTIKEYQKDAQFFIYKTLDALSTAVIDNTLRADEIFLTKEVFPNVNTSIQYFLQLLDNPFFRVDKVTYITEPDSSEIASINYIIELNKFDNWEIIEGHLTRPYVEGVINGTLRNEVINPKMKAVYRVPKDEYIRKQMREKQSLEEGYVSDEQNLIDIPPITPTKEVVSEAQHICKLWPIAGKDCDERTLFCYLVAQYLSLSGKTLILERDIEYHRLTEYVTKATPSSYILIEVKDLLNNPVQVIERIRVSTARLIVVGAIERIHYSYSFVLNILYNNLVNDVRNFVQEIDLDEAPTSDAYTCVFPSNMPGLLHMAEHMDVNTLSQVKFIGVHLSALVEIAIINSEAAKTILYDLLEVHQLELNIVAVNSLLIGGDSTYDLRSIIGS